MTKRNVAAVILLSIITCGIYGICWDYMTTCELNQCEDEEPLTNYIIAILLSLLTCGIYGIYWSYKFYKKVDSVTNSDYCIISFLLSLFVCPFIGMALTQHAINKMEDEE
jgi:hypothetical protein